MPSRPRTKTRYIRVLAVRCRDREPPFAYPPLISHTFFTEALKEAERGALLRLISAPGDDSKGVIH
jgi:hypothetical protein